MITREMGPKKRVTLMAIILLLAMPWNSIAPSPYYVDALISMT